MFCVITLAKGICIPAHNIWKKGNMQKWSVSENFDISFCVILFLKLNTELVLLAVNQKIAENL